jgi:gliding motility-associated-like protein
MKDHLYKAVFLIVFSLTAKAQLFYNKGASIYSDQAATIKVQGSVTNSNSGVLEHNGLVIIDSTFFNQNTATTKGSGIYDVYEHWINSGKFIRDTSSVNLKGTSQDIKGDSVTRYYNLSLLGNGVKSQYINSEVFNKLDLSVNELATRQDTMFLKNSIVSSLLGNFTFGSEAFVSNLDSGAFVRSTNSNNIYYYPMGSSVGTARFRPIQVTPNNNNSNEFSVSFHNYNATLNTFSVSITDTNLCNVNDKFFHKLGRIKGNTSADIEIGYLPSSDNSYSTIGNWKSGNTFWGDVLLVSNSNVIGSYTSNKRSGWSNFNNLPYSLANTPPTINGLLGDTLICSGNSSIYTFTNTGNYSFDWGVNGGSFINNDSTSSSVNINWLPNGNNNYTTLNVVDNTNGCISKTYTLSVSIGNLPTAGFNLATPPFTVGNPIYVQDASVNAVTYYYDLGNGTTSTNANSQTAFSNPGTYTIYQIVTDASGCTDTISKVINIENTFTIGNVFTPNGDGKNDIFSFNCAGCNDYDLEITNRWGQLMYHGNKGSEFWDGTTGSGEKVSEGTYFYILKIQYGSEEKLLKGFIQLFR